MSPYSACVVMRMMLLNLARRTAPGESAAGDHPVRASRDADLRHLAKVEHVIDLVGGKELVTLDELAHEHALLHRLLADLGSARVADVRHECGSQRRGTLDPVRAHVLIGLDPRD